MRYTTVEVTAEVELDSVIEGLSTAQKKQLLADLQEDLGIEAALPLTIDRDWLETARENLLCGRIATALADIECALFPARPIGPRPPLDGAPRDPATNRPLI